MPGAETFGTPRRMAMIVKNAVVNENEFVVRLEYENAVKIFWSDGLSRRINLRKRSFERRSLLFQGVECI